jgi:hypothetical protein
MSMLTKIIVSFFLLCSFAIQAQESLNQATEESIDESTEASSESSFINLKIGVELNALEKSAQQSADSISDISQSFKEMLDNPDLSDQQQRQIEASFKSVNNLALSFKNTIDKLPNTIEQTTPQIITVIDNVFQEIKITVIVVLVVIILILILALFAIYYLVLSPAKNMLVITTDRLNNMATALQTTAELVESSNKQHQEIIKSMQQMQDNKQIP